MRINSPSQIEASRQNGRKSSGPKSIKGKNRTRLNAQKHGLFSQEIIIESAGERLEDFEQFKRKIWDDYQPAGAMEELFVTDIVENAWRRLRVRRCETTETVSRIEAAEIRDRLECMKKVEKLKCEFMGRFNSLLGPAPIQGLQWDNQVQEALASTSLGMDFLISQMRGVELQVKADGYLSKHSEAMLEACGIDVFTITTCTWLSDEAKNELATLEAESSEKQPLAEESPADTDQSGIKRKRLHHRKSRFGKELHKSVGGVIAFFEERKQTLKSVETIEARTRATTILLPTDSIDRFSRAETAYERGMYRAISMLLALRGHSSRVPKLSDRAHGTNLANTIC